MKVVINNAYGGFSVPPQFEDFFVNKCGYDYCDVLYGTDLRVRTNTQFVKFVEECNAKSADQTPLRVIDIPDNASDFEIDEYDGLEHINAVIDGKIVHFYAHDADDDEEE